MENFTNDFLTISFYKPDDGLTCACYVKYDDGVDPNYFSLTLEELEAECSKAFGYPCMCDFVDVGEDGEEVYVVAKL